MNIDLFANLKQQKKTATNKKKQIQQQKKEESEKHKYENHCQTKRKTHYRSSVIHNRCFFPTDKIDRTNFKQKKTRAEFEQQKKKNKTFFISFRFLLKIFFTSFNILFLEQR